MDGDGVDVAWHADVPWLTVVGPLDYRTADPITDAEIDRLATDGELVVDLTALSFIDSTGLSLLLKLRHTAGSVRLIGTPPTACSLMRLTGVETLFVQSAAPAGAA